MTEPTTHRTKSLMPWILTLGVITMSTSVACGLLGEEENNMTTVDMSGDVDQGTTPDEDQGTTPDEDQGTTPDEDQGTTPDEDQGTTPDEDMGTEPDEDMGTEPTSNWKVMSHPCAGNRTDALHCDDDSTCYTGCGTTTSGRGMYVTTDGGVTWNPMSTTPDEFLNASRVNDIWRSPDDGLLYVAGDHSVSFGVVSVDDSGTIGEVFKRGNTVGFGFTPGNFRRGSSGRAVVESLTGVDLVYRNADSDDPSESWLDGSDAVSGARGRLQTLDLDVVGDDFYGCGSTIADTPRVYLPAWDADSEYDVEVMNLVDPEGLAAYNGEMWGIDADESGVVVGGVNQAAGVGMVYVFNAEGGLAPNDLANWSEFRVSKVPTLTGKATWVQGVCRSGNTIYAVGRESREGWGFVLRSQDAGESWEDISLYEGGASKSSLADAYRCHVTSTGGVIIAGSGGQFAVYED